MGCTFCGDAAVYLRRHSGERFCARCYIQAIEKQVQRTVTKYRMLKPDDRIALALSGGKDSVSLLHIMSRLEEKFPRSELIAITIDEGILQYRSEGLRIAQESCKKLGVEHHVSSFKKLYGYTLDEIAEAARQMRTPFFCAYCGILRRKALNLAARKVEATKLATAHNMDDEVQSLMMNLLRGDMVRMSRERKNLENTELVRRVKPLSEVPEKEVALYAFFRKVRFQSLPCPYQDSSLRSDVRKFLNMLEDKHPGMTYTIYRSFERIQPLLSFKEKRCLGQCTLCSEPTSGEVCMACQIFTELEIERR